MSVPKAESEILNQSALLNLKELVSVADAITFNDCSTLSPYNESLIVNSKGVPGTLGCIAYSNDLKMHVFLTNYHVLFGKHAKAGEDVWLLNDKEEQEKFYLIGRSLVGKIGIFKMGDQHAFIDCALGIFSDDAFLRAFIIQKRNINIKGTAEAKIGEHVTKTGGTTKFTTGIITNTNYHDVCNINGKIYQACNQILIKPANTKKFSDKGDSGSVVLNSRNEIVGLLWCVNENGEGIACPIEFVMKQLNICF
jgi:hypothetical protein